VRGDVGHTWRRRWCSPAGSWGLGSSRRITLGARSAGRLHVIGRSAGVRRVRPADWQITGRSAGVRRVPPNRCGRALDRVFRRFARGGDGAFYVLHRRWDAGRLRRRRCRRGRGRRRNRSWSFRGRRSRGDRGRDRFDGFFDRCDRFFDRAGDFVERSGAGARSEHEQTYEAHHQPRAQGRHSGERTPNRAFNHAQLPWRLRRRVGYPQVRGPTLLRRSKKGPNFPDPRTIGTSPKISVVFL
jgi:hypothetical protein